MQVLLSTALRLLLTVAFALPAAWGQPLPALGTQAEAVTVSGISSGGFMAVQFHVAHSSIVRGAGVLAGGPYYCAQGSAWTARNNCMQPGTWTPLPGTEVLVAQTQLLATAGLIDPPASLAAARVWLFSGRSDTTVRPAVVEALADYYRRFVPADRVTLVGSLDAGHAMVTADYGGACSKTAAPYLNDCDFDAAGALLEHLYGGLAAAVQPQGELLTFDQAPYAGAPYAISMDDRGFVYVPGACRAGGCRLHVAFHGCGQGREQIGEAFARHAGYNRWADSNRLVVLYPQAIARYGWGPWPWPTSFMFNPNGCWDWWGYTAAGYHTKAGPQIRAVKAMLERLGSRS
ncbi:MAG TPA: depolymerase [Burkholderiales bacterium]|nr:depolymerase [Burkholderiales bacterium]